MSSGGRLRAVGGAGSGEGPASPCAGGVLSRSPSCGRRLLSPSSVARAGGREFSWDRFGRRTRAAGILATRSTHWGQWRRGGRQLKPLVREEGKAADRSPPQAAGQAGSPERGGKVVSSAAPGRALPPPGKTLPRSLQGAQPLSSSRFGLPPPVAVKQKSTRNLPWPAWGSNPRPWRY